MANKYQIAASEFVATLNSTTAWDAADAERAFLEGTSYAELHLWNNPKTVKPNDGQQVLIYTIYTGAKSRQVRTLVEEFTYLEEYGFDIKEAAERDINLKVLAWMPIPVLNIED